MRQRTQWRLVQLVLLLGLIGAGCASLKETVMGNVPPQSEPKLDTSK